MAQGPELGIVVALREEGAAVEAALAGPWPFARDRVALRRSGMGGALASEAARKLLGESPALKLLAVSGFCGGLDESLALGDLVLAQAVAARRSASEPGASAAPLPADAARLTASQSALEKAGLRFRTGLLLTVAQPVLRAAEKLALGRATGAAAVDLESAAVARVAREKGIAFLALRAVSDAASDDLPEEVLNLITESGRVRAGQVLKYAAGGAARLKELWALKSRSDRAAAALTAGWRALLPAFLAEPGANQ